MTMEQNVFSSFCCILYYYYLLFILHTQNRGPEAKLHCGLQYKNINNQHAPFHSSSKFGGCFKTFRRTYRTLPVSNALWRMATGHKQNI